MTPMDGNHTDKMRSAFRLSVPFPYFGVIRVLAVRGCCSRLLFAVAVRRCCSPVLNAKNPDTGSADPVSGLSLPTAFPRWISRASVADDRAIHSVHWVFDYAQVGRPRGSATVQLFVVPLSVICSLAVAEPSYVSTSRRSLVELEPSIVMITFMRRITVPAVG